MSTQSGKDFAKGRREAHFIAWAGGAHKPKRTYLSVYSEGTLKGCAQLSKKFETTFLFGLLCVDPNLKGKGYGRDLLDFMERTARENDAQTLQLELLEPAQAKHTHKAFLRDWYTRKEYHPTHQEGFPMKDILAVQATFTIFEKALG